MLLKLLNYLKSLPILVIAILSVPYDAYCQIPPTAVWDYVYTDDDVAATGSLAENDLNPSGSTLTYSLLSNTNLGQLTLLPNGDWTFVPVLGIAGVNQTIWYQVCDQINQCSSDSIVVVVRFQNNAPEPAPDYISVEIDEPRFGDASINDIEPDSISDPVSSIDSYADITAPLHGDLIFFIDGTFQYTPDPGYTGPDSFNYIMCDPCGSCAQSTVYITVVGINEEPVGSNSPVYDLNEDTSFSGNALPLVTDPENDALTFTTATSPSHGNVVMSSNGTYIYTPNLNYFGPDNFLYVACDIVGQCTVGFIYFNVLNLNDAPITGNELFTTNEDIPAYNNTVAGNDFDDGGSIVYSILQSAANGTFSLETNGSFSYSPASNYFGQEIILIQACDPALLCSTDTLVINVTALNDFPIATNDDKFGYEDAPINNSVAGNDSDPDGDALTFSITNSADNGSITMLPNGSFSYLGNANFAGFDTITYQACDPFNACSSATLVIEVIEINDDPIIVADTYSGTEDNAVSGNLRVNDIEPDGELINYFSTSGPDHGSLDLNWEGVFIYTPFANWSGIDTVTYYGCDPCSVCSLATLIITITPVNDIPVASSSSISTNEDQSLTNSIASNAQDLEDNTLTFSIVNAATHGTFNLSANGNYTYTPQSNYSGSDQITFSACDAQGECSNAVVNITVVPVNDYPVALDDSGTTNEDQPLMGTVANDSDADDLSLNYVVITPPMHGTILMSANGTYTYTPDSNYNGVDMLTYSVCDDENACDAGVLIIDIDALNDAPIATDDANVTYENSSLNGNVSNNDLDVDGDLLTYTLDATAQHGTFNLLSNGSYTYVPNTNYSGSDVISYTVCDPLNACASAVLNITVFPTNTAPVAANLTLPDSNEDAIINGNLVSEVTDAEGGVMIFTVLVAPLHGTLDLTNNGSFTYTPDANYFGTDSFSYQVCDTGELCDNASVNITIDSVNDTPSVTGEEFSINEDNSLNNSVAANDNDADQEVLNYSVISGPVSGSFNLTSNGNFSFSPASNFNGTLTVVYSVCDPNSACTQGTLVINVLPVNDAPVVLADDFTTNEDNVLNNSVASNDSDLDNVSLNYSIVSNTTQGTLQLFADGNFIYTPNANFFGSDSFQYSACDAGPLCVNATVNITVNSVNDIPVVTDDVVTIAEDNVATGDVSSFGSDADGETLLFTAAFGAVNGNFILEQDGQFSYTPDPNFFGSEMINYTACDPQNACVEGTLYIMVTPVNDLPITAGETFTTNEDFSISNDLGLNDSDAESTQLEFAIVTGPSNGTIDLLADGSFTYTPDPNFFGTENIIYNVCDDDNGCVETNLTINVTGVNDIPVVMGEYQHVMEDTSGNGDLALNDSDADGDVLTYSISINALHGNFILTPGGDFQYTPTPDFSGMDSVTYTVCDIQNVCVSTKIIFEVDFMNDNPIAVDESIEVLMNTLVSGSLLDNEIEPDGEILHYFVLVDESNGTFDLLDDGTYTYLPNDGVFGTFYVTYYACDPCAVCDEGMITIYVVQPGEENTAPVALNTSTNLCQGGSVNISLNELVNDIQNTDADLNFEISDPGEGTFLFDQASHNLTYTGSLTGSNFVTIEYTVCDQGLVPLCASGAINVNVLNVTSPNVGTAILTNVDCFNNETGAIDLTDITGGNNFTFEWNNGPLTEDISNLPAGEYIVTISSDEACSLPASITYVIEQPAAVLDAIVSSSTGISDGSNGTINLDITGGTEPYEVYWTGPSNFTSTDEDLSDITADGNYEAEIIDAHGCVSQASSMITGIETLDGIVFQVSPNPFRESFNLKLTGENSGKISYRIFDASGKLITDQSSPSFKSGTTSIDMKSQPAGCYQLQVIAGDFTRTVGIIKE